MGTKTPEIMLNGKVTLSSTTLEVLKSSARLVTTLKRLDDIAKGFKVNEYEELTEEYLN